MTGRLAVGPADFQLGGGDRAESEEENGGGLRQVARAGVDLGCLPRAVFSLEHEENEDPRATCPKYIDELREAFA